MPRTFVLILSGSDDRPAACVADKINAGPGQAILLDPEGSSQFEFSMDCDGRATIIVDGEPLPPISRVWNRAKMRLEVVATTEQRDEFLRRTEWAGAFRTLISSYGDLVVNDPLAQMRCDQKTEQQNVAASLGLRVPPTLVTNSRAAALRFADLHGELICKATGRPQLPYNQAFEGPSAMLTCGVSRADIEAIEEEDFARSATLLQKRLPKAFEYRVAVVARRLFAFRIHSQDSELTRLDWRVACDEIRHELAELPSPVEKALLGFMDWAGLWHGHFDLIEAPDGSFWFLECNPNGEWLWLDRYVDGALSNRYAEALCAARDPS